MIPSNEVLITDKDWNKSNKEYLLTNKDRIVKINNNNPNKNQGIDEIPLLYPSVNIA